MTSKKNLYLVGIGPGIGAAVAQRFAREGYAIGAIARREETLRAALAPLEADGLPVVGVAADAGDPVSLRHGLARLQAAMGDASVLVYNAAAAPWQPWDQVTPEGLQRDLAVSIGGAVTATQAVLPAMRAAGAGTLLFTGGGFAFEPMPEMATLGVGKAGLRNLAFSLHAALAPAGIHAATVTVCGMVKAGTAFDPARIADAYWQLHAQPPGQRERELQFRG